MGRATHRCESYRAEALGSARMTGTQTGVRIALAAEGSANVATGLPVLDHLISELARTARFKVSLEVARRARTRPSQRPDAHSARS